jgi:hypothetical protein
MAFTATVQSINLQNDQFLIAVLFNDSATGYTSTKTYTFANDGTTTQTSVVNKVTTDGAVMKANLTVLNQIQSKVGTIIVI